MSSQSKDSDRGVNRREVMAAAGAALALTPLAAFVRSALGGELPAARREAELDAWSIDDMWTGYPRHAEPIGYPRPRRDLEVARAVDPVDAPFLV